MHGVSVVVHRWGRGIQLEIDLDATALRQRPDERYDLLQQWHQMPLFRLDAPCSGECEHVEREIVDPVEVPAENRPSLPGKFHISAVDGEFDGTGTPTKTLQDVLDGVTDRGHRLADRGQPLLLQLSDGTTDIALGIDQTESGSSTLHLVSRLQSDAVGNQDVIDERAVGGVKIAYMPHPFIGGQLSVPTADRCVGGRQRLAGSSDQLWLALRQRKHSSLIGPLDDLQQQHAHMVRGEDPLRRIPTIAFPDYHLCMARRAPYSPPKFTADMRSVILRGKDAFLMQMYTQRLVETLESVHGTVERFDFDGDSVEPATVLDELRSYGLLQEHKIVVVNQADRFLSNSPGAKGPSRTRKLLETYVEAPVESATLLLRAETWKAGKLDKLVQANGLMHKIDLDESTDTPFAMAWCKGRVRKAHGADIEESAAALLIRRIGLDFARLDTELGKLAALVGQDGSIERQHVIDMTGISREEQAWAIQDAVLSGQVDRAVRTLRELEEISRQPVELIMWSLIDLLRKLHAASAMLRAGFSTGDVARQQRLFGAGRDRILGLARSADPAHWSAMLRDPLRRQHAIRSGYGRSERTLEGITIRIADTLNMRSTR